MKKRNHHSCSIVQKLEALNRLEKGESQKKIAEDYGVGESTVRDWKRMKASLEKYKISSFSEVTLKNRKTLKIQIVLKLVNRPTFGFYKLVDSESRWQVQ